MEGNRNGLLFATHDLVRVCTEQPFNIQLFNGLDFSICLRNCSSLILLLRS